MATPREVRAALADALREIGGIQVSDYTNANPQPPCAEIRRGPVLYHQAMQDGVSFWTMLVRVYVATISDKNAALRLDAFLAETGDSSVKAALELDTTLGGIVSDVTVSEATGENAYVVEGLPILLGSEFTVTVYA